MAYRRRIWDLNPEYALNKGLEHVDLKMIALLQSIEAAKKRTPPIPIACLLSLAEKLKSPPKITVNALEFATYINSLILNYGVGIKTAVCMLAVVSNGVFPPMDEKLARGLWKRKVILKSEEKMLNRNNTTRFSDVYINKVLKEWKKELDNGLMPDEIDTKWANQRKRLKKERT